MPDDFEPIEKADVLMAEVRSLQTKVRHTPEPADEDDVLLIILNEIPLFNRVLRRINGTTSAISKLVKKTGDAPTAILNTGIASPIIGIALNVLDFIQIPLIYLASFALGRKPPITLSNNARWLYAAVLLTLCLVAFTIPAIAPFISIASAVIGFGASAFILSKLLSEYYKDKQDFKALTEKINNSSFADLQALNSKLEIVCKEDSQNHDLINALIDDISALKNHCAASIETIKALNQEAHLIEQKLNIESDLLDSCVGILLSSAAIAGTVVTLFFPPVGLLLLCATTLAGAAYVVSRFVASYLTELKCQSILKKDIEDIAPELESASKPNSHKVSTSFVPHKPAALSRVAETSPIDSPRKSVAQKRHRTHKINHDQLDTSSMREQTTSLKRQSKRMKEMAAKKKNPVEIDKSKGDSELQDTQFSAPRSRS